MKVRAVVLSLFLVLGLVPGFVPQPALAAGEYTHPSEAFTVVPFGTLEDETENGALFVEDGAVAMVTFGQALVQVTPETVPSIVVPILDGIQGIDSYELAYDEVTELENGYAVAFNVVAAEDAAPYTAGEAFVTLDGDVLYLMVLLTEDYDAVGEAWAETVLSFTPGAPVVAEPTPQATPAGKKPTPAPTTEEGEILSGFEPETNGFSFENYGNEANPVNLEVDDMVRMFGEDVCAGTDEGTCLLAPQARQWMDQVNGYMDDGHCEGMAVLSSLMYYGQVDPVDFGGDVAHDLELVDNDPLQREIAYWWTTQSTYPGSATRVADAPSVVLDTLVEAFADGIDASEWWALGIYMPDGSAGHAVTPIGVEELGGGNYEILIYDNNFPDETRAIEVDRDAETWQYEGSPNPELESFLYTGDAETGTLEIVAISPRLEKQQCDFCAGGGASVSATRSAKGGKLAANPQYPAWAALQSRWALLVDGVADEFYQIWLTGDTPLLIVDDWGRRFGFDAGEFVDEIPGAFTQNMKVFSPPKQELKAGAGKSPVFRVPVGLSFEVMVDGTFLKEAATSDVAMIGPGYYLDVTGVYLEPGDIESIGVRIDKSRHQLTYSTLYSESPEIQMGVETEEAAFAFIVQATELVGAEDTFDVALDMATNEFILNTSYNTDPSVYSIYVLRVDDTGEYVFGADGVTMDPENTAYIPFTQWEGPGSPLTLDFDAENDGEIDESFELPDVTETMDFYAEQ